MLDCMEAESVMNDIKFAGRKAAPEMLKFRVTFRDVSEKPRPNGQPTCSPPGFASGSRGCCSNGDPLVENT